LTNTDGDTTQDRVNNRYSLVVLAAKRAKQLKEGAPPLIETTSTNMLTIALEEIASGKVTYTEAVEPVKLTADDDAEPEAVVTLEENFLSVSSSAPKPEISENLPAELAAFLPIGEDDADSDEDDSDEDAEDIEDEAEPDDEPDDDSSDLAEKA